MILRDHYEVYVLSYVITIAFSVLHVNSYVQFTSIFNSYVTDVRLSCLY